MADSFFGFDTDFPGELGVLGRPGFDEELLTPDVEEEYDALNDETFGQAANDDWEEAHEKLSELIKNNNIDVKSYFKDSLLENDESQVEIVSKSISQLGLEDDLDDPAIMTVSRNCQPPMSRLGSVFGPSPPPPAILETENCGSPKTHSIWSTTPKDSGLSFLHSFHSHNSTSSLAQQEPRTSLNSTSDSVFLTPQKACWAEELEKDLLSESAKEQPRASNNSWPQTSQINTSSNQNLSNKFLPRFPVNTVNSLNKVNRVLTREEVERQMLADQRLNVQNKAASLPPPPSLPHMTPPMVHPNMIPPARSGGNSINTSHPPPPVVPIGIRGPIMRGPLERPFVPFSNNVHPRNMLNHQMPRSDYMLPNPSVGGTMNPFIGFPRQINHPLMPHYRQIYEKHHDNDNYRNEAQNVEDEYAGLMTQKEKDWLCKIQLMLLKSENPYVEDYYYTTQLARRCKKKYSENAKKGGGDAPELILPETPKLENKTYVPTQFEGSLGKLQAVSVNFPRKVLDIKVARPLEDDEGRIVTNQCLMKFRRLLLDIEKLYTYFLEIEDEEKRILAKPDTGEAPHRKNIASLTLKIFNGLCSENSSDDNFENMMTIRKGRNLLARVFPLFSLGQQVQCLIYLCRSLSLILKKDQNDLVLIKNYEIFTNSILKCSLKELVQLGEALENGMSSENMKEKNNVVAALKNKFGSTVICSMIKKAEDLYSGLEIFDMDIQTRWANVILYIVDIICNLENESLSPPLMPSSSLLKHFQRFDVANDKFDILKEKLLLLERDSKSVTEISV